MQKVLIAGLGSFCMALIVILVIGTLALDKEGPVIEYTAKQFSYTEGMDTSVLLEDVTARDSRDGDVTSNIIIENIVTLDDVDSAVVIYAAKDNANNITKMERIIDYSPTNQTENEEEMESATLETGDVETSAGVEVALNTEDEAESNEEEQAATDARTKALAEGKPYLELTTHEVTLKKGDSFNYANYIKEAVDDKDNVYRKVRVSRTFDMNKVGKYEVELYVQDSDGNDSDKETIKLTVEE